MARNEVQIAAPREQVYALLSDPRSYGCWVVGSQRIRAADANWPAPGSSFDHRVGVGPLGLKDHTDVIAVPRPGAARALRPGVAAAAGPGPAAPQRT